MLNQFEFDAVIRRKSATERLAETKYNYIRSSAPLMDRDVNTSHKVVQKSLSAGVKPSIVVISQSHVHHPHYQLNHSHLQPSFNPIKRSQTFHSSCSSTPQPVLTRKRNSSMSSRLSSEGSNNLEQQLRQLIGENSEEQNNNENHLNTEIKVQSVMKDTDRDKDTQLKPKPRERTKSINSMNRKDEHIQQAFSQKTSCPVLPKQRTIFMTETDKTTQEKSEQKTKDCILRYNSSHKNTMNNSKAIKPLAPQPKSQSNQLVAMRSATASGITSRQMSISRSKSDVSNRLLVRRNKSKDEIERFFETLGLDSSVWDSIKSEASVSTPAHYFESCESFESDIRPPVPSSNSSTTSSSTDRHSTDHQPQRPTLNTRLMQSRSCNALSSGTSIVEKNARVIKWLYNCRRALIQQ